jgi:hypothetical protein
VTGKTRGVVGVLGALLLAFGLGCLNYTRADALEHHRAVARQHDWPEPGRPIFYSGVASAVFGAGAIGFAVGRRTARGG